MVRRAHGFLLAVSLTALSGAASIFGCSKDEDATVIGGTADASVDANRTDSAAPDAATCLSSEAIDPTKFPYAKPVRSAGACTAEERAALSSFYESKTEASQAVKVSEWSAVVSPKCAACVFSGASGDWAPIITEADKVTTLNRGGCVELQSGNAACGRAYQQSVECQLEACRKQCRTQDEFEACSRQAAAIASGPCKAAADAVAAACGPLLGSYVTACTTAGFNFEGPIGAQCITGGPTVVDAGPGDAGPGDAGDAGSKDAGDSGPIDAASGG